MSKANRQKKRAAKFGVPVPLLAKTPLVYPSKTPFVAWLRSVGIGAILLGGFGLMKTFYLPSVLAIYGGLSILCVDAFCEKLQISFKAAMILALIGVGFLFTQAVVLHGNPMQYGYRFVDNDGVEMSVRNDSLEDDYTDLDLLVTPSQIRSLRFVGDAQIVSGDHSCFLLRFPNEIPNGRGSYVYSDGKSVITVSDSFRLRCDNLPHSSTVWIHAKIVGEPPRSNVVPTSPTPPVPANPIGVPLAVGSFAGKFRTEKVNIKFSEY